MKNTTKILALVLVLMTVLMSISVLTVNAAAGQTWTVAGESGLCGSNWDTTDTNNDMTYDEATDSYVKVFKNVKAGTYQFKCAKDHAWNTSYPSSNKSVTVAKDGSTVTITLKGTSVSVAVEAPSCDHQYSITAETVTCTTAGVRTWTCSVCSESYTEDLAALGHHYVDGKCERCDATTEVVRVYVENAAKWADVYCYTWDTNPYVSWPGEKMTLDTESGLYYYDIPKNFVNVIFSNGSGTQSADLKVPTGTATIYNNSTKAWSAPHVHSWSDATCTEAQKCGCGETQGEALGHDYVAGVCSRCEAVDPDYVAPGYNWWVSDGSLYTVEGNNIKYNGAGNTYACVGCDVTELAAGNNTFTITITNNGTAEAKVRVDLQATVQVGNHKVVNTGAVGGDVWTDAEWGGSHVHVAPGESVTLVITYDETTERGAVKDLIIFADSGRGDEATYSADITVSDMAFSYVAPAHVNTLVVGDTNKIVIDDDQDNGYGYYIELVPFVVEEAAYYSLAGEGLTIWLYDSTNALISMTGAANLEAGTYFVFIAANTPATTGEYNVAVTKAAWVNALAVGDNKILITDALDNGAGYYIVWVPFEVTEKANYTFTGEGILALVYDAAYQAVATTELDVGTYNICVAFLTQATTGVANVTVTKGGDAPVVEDPALALGDNTVVIDGSTTNFIGNAVAWLTFTPETAGTYTFASEELTAYIYADRNMGGTALGTGVAELEAGVTYYVLVGKGGITGEFTVNVSAGGVVVAPNTIVVGDNHYVISDALLSVGFEFIEFTVAEPGTYVITGGAPMKVYVFTLPNVDLGTASAGAFGWNVDAMEESGFASSFEVTLPEAGTYWFGVNYEYVTEEREFDINISLKADEQPPVDDDPTDDPVDEGPKDDETPAAPEMNWFEKIIAMIIAFFKKLFGLA